MKNKLLFLLKLAFWLTAAVFIFILLLELVNLISDYFELNSKYNIEDGFAPPTPLPAIMRALVFLLWLPFFTFFIASRFKRDRLKYWQRVKRNLSFFIWLNFLFLFVMIFVNLFIRDISHWGYSERVIDSFFLMGIWLVYIFLFTVFYQRKIGINDSKQKTLLGRLMLFRFGLSVSGVLFAISLLFIADCSSDGNFFILISFLALFLA